MPKTILTGRRLALMLLLYAKGATGHNNEPVEGRTRLTKLLFLLNEEHDVFKRASDLHFEPYAFGPYDPKLYDDLAFLENMGWMRGSAIDTDAPLTYSDVIEPKDGPAAYLEASELDEADLSFEYLMGGVAENVPERYETRKYALSEKGREHIQRTIQSARKDANLPKLMKAIEEVKGRYNSVPLRDFLRTVYKRYPDSATDSTILEQLRVR